MEYAIFPCPAPRMTKSDRWRDPPRRCVAKYWAFRDRAKHLKIDVPAGSQVTFYMPTPASWSKKKNAAMQGKPHTQKPDLDNLLKALLDAVYGDDSHIWKISAQKVWRDRPGIKVEQILKQEGVL